MLNLWESSGVSKCWKKEGRGSCKDLERSIATPWQEHAGSCRSTVSVPQHGLDCAECPGVESAQKTEPVMKGDREPSCQTGH